MEENPRKHFDLRRISLMANTFGSPLRRVSVQLTDIQKENRNTMVNIKF